MLDSNVLTALTAKFLISALIFVRVLGLFSSGQFFSNQNIPMQVKIILSIILTSAMASQFIEEQPAIDYHLWNLVLLAAKEFLVGAILGFATNIVFWTAKFGGAMVDFDLGFQAATLFDRDSGSPSLVGEFFNLTALMIFLILNGHHFVIEAMFMSLRAVPLTTFEMSKATVSLLIKMPTTIMLIGIKIAAPVIISMFAANLALALLARIAPQTNIFMISFQVKIAVGLLVLIAAVPLLVIVLKIAMTESNNELMKVLLSLNPGKVS